MRKIKNTLVFLYVFGSLVFSIALAFPHGFWAIVAGLFVMWPILLVFGSLLYAGITGAGNGN